MSKCPPLRALTCDYASRVKVIESKGDADAKVVQEWGDIDFDNPILGVSRDRDLLAVSRENGSIRFMHSVDGSVIRTVSIGSTTPRAGLHLFRTAQDSKFCRLLTGTSEGEASISKINLQTGSVSPEKTWEVYPQKMHCSRLHQTEGYAVFGGKGKGGLCVWDVERGCAHWKDEPPPKKERISNPNGFVGITSVVFQDKHDARKIVVGTNNSEVRIYDTSVKKYAMLTIPFKTTPITAVSEDIDDEHKIYCGNGFGDVASIDLRATGNMVQEYSEKEYSEKKCSKKEPSEKEPYGNITSIARHPEQSVIASSGWNSYVRIWDTKSSQLISKVHVEDKSTNVIFDS